MSDVVELYSLTDKQIELMESGKGLKPEGEWVFELYLEEYNVAHGYKDVGYAIRKRAWRREDYSKIGRSVFWSELDVRNIVESEKSLYIRV